jgi:hypothetical protein
MPAAGRGLTVEIEALSDICCFGIEPASRSADARGLRTSASENYDGTQNSFQKRSLD